MIVLVLTVVPPRLRGHVSRWLMEISPGVYVGKVSARVRELLWEQVRENIADGRAVMVFPQGNEQGLGFRVHGQEWEPVDYDGLTLMMRPNTKAGRSAGRRTGWSKAARYRRYGR